MQNSSTATAVLSSKQFLDHWQHHRRLTRKLIEAFSEKDLFSFSIGGMRPFGDMVAELLAIAGPGLEEIATGKPASLQEQVAHNNSKSLLLELWDASTAKIDGLRANMETIDYQKEILSFGQFPGTVQSSLFYFLDNEIHHRGQAYVYLRSLGITPPLFYEA